MAQQKSLGDLEQQVMEFLWRNGPSTGDVVRAAVSKDRSLTDSTIRTVLRRLEAKQFVKHEMDGRQFIYSSSREPRKVAAEDGAGPNVALPLKYIFAARSISSFASIGSRSSNSAADSIILQMSPG
jgi:hypothetical protein